MKIGGSSFMKKKEQDLQGKVPEGKDFVPTEMGSARFVALDREGSAYKYETGPTEYEQGFPGPPWGVEPSMQFLCDEVGIDFTKFVDSLAGNKKEMEMAQEFGVSEATIKSLRERFYKAEAIMGNYGQD
jgi:hypothetical protein